MFLVRESSEKEINFRSRVWCCFVVSFSFILSFFDSFPVVYDDEVECFEMLLSSLERPEDTKKKILNRKIFFDDFLQSKQTCQIF